MIPELGHACCSPPIGQYTVYLKCGARNGQAALGHISLYQRAESGLGHEQLVERALLDHTPGVQHVDPLRFADGGQPVSDHDTSGSEALDPLHDLGLAARFESVGGLVEKHDPRVAHQRRRNPDPLNLSPGEGSGASIDNGEHIHRHGGNVSVYDGESGQPASRRANRPYAGAGPGTSLCAVTSPA